MKASMYTLLKVAVGGAILVGAVGCHTDMWVQPKTKPLQQTELFPDGKTSRPLVAGTVARDHLKEDDAYYTGKVNGKLITELPMTLNEAELKSLIERGQERFNVYCSPCHGRTGDGGGMITQRGLALRRPPANYHTDRLRNMPIGHFYDVISNGYGVMFSYGSRVEPQDRWAIAAYIRALQLSQNFSPQSQEDLDAIEAGIQAQNAPPPADAGHEGGGH
jgi:mono/diheme cytochrome c family protein